jgi:hypothetical protein
MSDEIKQAFLASIIGFNITVIVYILYRVLTREDPWFWPTALGAGAVAIGFGLVVAIIVFLVAYKLNQ